MFDRFSPPVLASAGAFGHTDLIRLFVGLPRVEAVSAVRTAIFEVVAGAAISPRKLLDRLGRAATLGIGRAKLVRVVLRVRP